MLKGSYAQFVAKMLRGELSFSLHDYQTNLNAHFPSPVVRQFLESSAGYEFTRDLARQVARVYQDAADPAALPAWSSRLVEAVVTSLRESGTGAKKLKAPKRFAKPFLCLDVERSSLRIRFDSRVFGTGIRVNGRPLLYPSEPVRTTTSPQFRSGVTTPEPVNPWWTPAHGGWALFRIGDGALVATGFPPVETSVSVGDYYLVTNHPSKVSDSLIQEDEVALDVTELDDPVWDYSVVRICRAQAAQFRRWA